MPTAFGNFHADISATRYHDFSYGHVVLGHESKCANLHGHNGWVTFTVVAQALDNIGRVVDFSVINTLLCQWVEREWDHRFLISQDHPFATMLSQADKTVVVLPFNPTAENLATFLLRVIAPMQLAGTGLVCQWVHFEETRKCSARAAIPWTLDQYGSEAYFKLLTRDGPSEEEQANRKDHGGEHVWPK